MERLCEEAAMEKMDNIILHRRFLTFYKKNTLALFLSFALSFMLASAMLVLIHTNHRTENIEYQTMFTPSDCLIEDLSWKQAEKLKNNTAVNHIALVEQDYSSTYSKNGKSFYLQKGDSTYITLMAKIMEGRLPETQDEIAAEKWALLNLGAEPEINQEFQFEDGNGKTRNVKVTGILSDMRGNIEYGTLHLYTSLKQDAGTLYNAHVTFKNEKDYDNIIKNICKELGIKEKQAGKCPAREDFDELYHIDVQIMAVILFVCLIIFYGIYKIILASREKQYGILRALGMKRRQLYGMVLMELYQVYFPAAVTGITAGVFIAWAVANISGDTGTIVYLYGQSVKYNIVIPVWQIIFCVFIMAVFTGLAGYFTSRGIMKKPVVETISGIAGDKGNRLHFPGINSNAGKARSLFSLSCNYILRNIKLSVFVVITICTGVVLFTGLLYKAETLNIYREDTKELWYLNGQYEMSMKMFNSPYQGVPRQDAEKILKLPGVNGIKTSASVPVRVVDEDNVKRNDKYYNEINAHIKKYYGYELRGYDDKNQIYKTILSGYNTNALKELKKYIVSGDFNPENIKEDEIILAVLSTDNIKQKDSAGWYKDGKRLMDYKAGDKITMKYRADFDTDNIKYEKLKDTGKYIYKTYKIKAVVSFEYMYDCNRSDVYPHLITNDKNIQKIVPDGYYQCIYIDSDKNMAAEEHKKLERELINTSVGNAGVSTRSLAENIKQNEMFYHKQMVYIYGIAIIVFILVLINMANNLRYRMYLRTREICMLRAVGMSVSMARQIFVTENIILCMLSIITAGFLSYPVLRYLYKISDMEVFGHKFLYNYNAFITISAATMILCILLSMNILKSWKTRQITDAMERVG